MISSILDILSFKAFIARSDDPSTHFTRKVGSDEFIVAVLGHQHIKYARARLKNRKLQLGKPVTAFCENLQKAEMDAPWVAELMTEAAGTKYLLLGLNVLFSNLKVYPAEQKLKDIERAFSTNLEAEVGKTFERQTKYFLSQAGRQICLNGVEREQITRPIEKFRQWGFDVVCAFHYPTAIMACVSAMPLDWENPGMLVYYSQKLMFFLGWNNGEILTLRSRLIAEGQRGGTGTRPALNALSKEIETTVQIVSARADNAQIANLYVHHDRQDPAFGAVENIQKNGKALVWPADVIVSQVQPYPEPDLGIVSDIRAAT